MSVIRNGEACYTKDETKQMLRISLRKSAKDLKQKLEEIKLQNKEEIYV